MEHIGKIIKRVMNRWKHCKKCEIYHLKECNCLDYETNRFIFKGWIESTCSKCQSKLANMLDKENIKDNIKYCYDCKQRKVGN